MSEVNIIGGGLAGCEAAWQVVRAGAKAVIHEMKPSRFSPAHSLSTLSELVCSNSLKSDSIENASGLLKEEMRLAGSLIIEAAEATRVPAGKTLAVDRVAFSQYVTSALVDAGVEVRAGEVTGLAPARPLVIATGPLTSDAMAAAIQRLVGRDSLHFYDAVAPIVYRESIDMARAFMASRWGKGGDDYINCPFEKDEYERFFSALTAADRVSRREFEDAASFEACMPIEVMAERGPKTLLFGPMRPVGLTDPATGRRPYAVVQLRRENAEGTLYNIVGFQTRLTYPEQKKVFRLIPGLESAEFARLGKLHRNSYLDSPGLLLPTQQLRSDPCVLFAGQITGVEGYCESAASGILAGINAVRLSRGAAAAAPPPTTMTGALMAHISTPPVKKRAFQPMNANMGILPALPGRDRRQAQARRAIEDFAGWLKVITCNV
ncbi:MAG: methylenetetrahydrofolate--tRNA-(uracil(54)-C(5))-methyltransferase (FADH(2)-oxidizing) TrmFO [Thermodesulfobacteriota bacterium]